MTSEGAIRSANWHLTERCNYRCRFCFFRTVGEMEPTIRLASRVLGSLRDAGIEKLNLVGGEPLLHPGIVDICRMARDQGFVVGMTSNGSLLTSEMLDRLTDNVDWFGISIDSASEMTERTLGRGTGSHVSRTMAVCRDIRSRGHRLKINTTVTSLNWREDLRPLVSDLNPERWKVFQVRHIGGQNDAEFQDLEVTPQQFDAFRRTNEELWLPGGHWPVFETCGDMIGSYLMVSPQGNVLSNRSGRYEAIGRNIRTVAQDRNIIDVEKYHRRGGVYAWK